MSKYRAGYLRTTFLLLLVFLVLSLADLFLTWKLIRQGSERIQESNPVAAWWLAKYGWWGLAAFKIAGVALVGCLAGVIARWRPRTGEKVLIFGCGALSTVVVSSLFLGWSTAEQPSRSVDAADMERWASAPDNELFTLVNQRAIQEELHLSERQAADFARLTETHQLRLREAVSSGKEAWKVAVEDVLAERRAAMDELETGQRERLQQIVWQQRGLNAFSELEVKQRLELTAQQEERIGAILAAPRPPPAGFARFRDHRPEGWRPPENEAARPMNQVLAVLTADQRDKWNEMTGKPYRSDVRPGFGNPPGPWRDSRPH